MYGKIPRMPIDLLNNRSETPAVEDFIKKITGSIRQARENILKAQQGQKTQADKHRRDHTFKIGDLVRLSTKNLNLPVGTRKLSPKWVGPYKITDQFGKDTFKIDLRGTFPIHLNFHVSLLQPWNTNDDEVFPDRKQEIPEPILIDNQNEYLVKAILGK